MKIWEGCYDESWKGILPDSAFAHPAKFSKCLLERIYDYMEQNGWIQKGDAIGDPFAGVCCGAVIAVYRGFKWVGVEIEPHFHELGFGTLMKHTARWHKLFGRETRAAVLRGDSRKFDELVSTASAIVTSPPYAEITPGQGGLNTLPPKKPGQQSGRSASSPSQLGAIVASPPYISGGHHNDVFDAWNVNSRGQQIKKGKAGYGKTEGQIAQLKTDGYWHAMDKVYSACYRALRPGGYMAIVIKDFVRNGKRQRLCDNTMDLLGSLGFERVERVHAKLVQHYDSPDLFEGEKRTTKTRKSFFRRLHESRMPADSDCRIDEEEVLFVCKP